jgi:hypothetical protein
MQSDIARGLENEFAHDLSLVEDLEEGLYDPATMNTGAATQGLATRNSGSSDGSAGEPIMMTRQVDTTRSGVPSSGPSGDNFTACYRDLSLKTLWSRH